MAAKRAKKKPVPAGLEGSGASKPGLMNKTINQLIQLQELSIAKEQEASAGGHRVAQIDESITALLGDLPDTLATQYRRLSAKGILAIVPVANLTCSACGMNLAKSLVQMVRSADRIQQCPTCARLLYLPEVDLRGIGRRPMRGEAPKAGVAKFSSSELMIPALEATTKEEVLSELTDKLEAEGFIDDASIILENALNREVMASTGVDHGLAFPHVRGVEGGGLTLTIGISKKGIKFDPESRKLTRLFFFMVIPTAASAFYLRLLAGLTQSFRESENRERLMVAGTSDAMWKELVKITRTTVK